jgi:hypothetical protein
LSGTAKGKKCYNTSKTIFLVTEKDTIFILLN